MTATAPCTQRIMEDCLFRAWFLCSHLFLCSDQITMYVNCTIQWIPSIDPVPTTSMALKYWGSDSNCKLSMHQCLANLLLVLAITSAYFQYVSFLYLPNVLDEFYACCHDEKKQRKVITWQQNCCKGGHSVIINFITRFTTYTCLIPETGTSLHPMVQWWKCIPEKASWLQS